MPAPKTSIPSSFRLCAALFGAVMATLPLSGLAANAEAPPAAESGTLDPAATYQLIDLKDLVRKSRTEVPGQRIIFAPSPIKFRATLASLPSPQKADYLLTALSMMKIATPPKVSQRIGLDYGGEQAMAAYIADDVAIRLGKEIKVGQALTFYAFHVYNYSRGPALLITSYGE